MNHDEVRAIIAGPIYRLRDTGKSPDDIATFILSALENRQYVIVRREEINCLRNALNSIKNQDYRGNRCSCSEIAHLALRTWID